MDLSHHQQQQNQYKGGGGPGLEGNVTTHVYYLRERLIAWSHDSPETSPSSSSSSSSSNLDSIDLELKQDYMRSVEGAASLLSTHHADHYRVFVLYPPRASLPYLKDRLGASSLDLTLTASSSSSSSSAETGVGLGTGGACDQWERSPRGAGILPLSSLLTICRCIEDWLKQDPLHVAVLHTKSHSNVSARFLWLVGCCYLRWVADPSSTTLSSCLDSFPNLPGRVVRKSSTGIVSTVPLAKLMAETSRAPLHIWDVGACSA